MAKFKRARVTPIDPIVVCYWEERIPLGTSPSGFPRNTWVKRFETVGVLDLFGATNRVGQFARNPEDKPPYDAGVESGSFIYLFDYTPPEGWNWDSEKLCATPVAHLRCRFMLPQWGDEGFVLTPNQIDAPTSTTKHVEVYLSGPKIQGVL